MITCPECSAASYHGVLFCRGCGAPLSPAAASHVAAGDRGAGHSPALVGSEPVRRSLGVKSARPADAATDRPATSRGTTRRFSLEQLAPGGVSCILRVTIGETSIRVPLAAGGVVHIGRSDPAAGFAPEIDLDPYDGFEAGVSRRHATIQSCLQGIVVADQGSSNGTWLDGRRLAPGFAYLLAATADVKLGELVVQVSLED